MVFGYTEHSHRHISIVSKRAGDILEKLGYPARTVELARIAGYLHDIGNCVNRTDHAHSGAILAYNILKDMEMPVEERKKWRQLHGYKIYSKTGDYNLLKQENSKKRILK